MSIQMTPIRVVCANTLNLAMDRAGDRRLSIRHTAGAVARIQDVGDWLAGINRTFDDSADAWRILARRSIRAWEMIDYLQTLFPDPTEDAKRNCARATREKILDRFEAGIGTDFTRATWWRLYNAVVEYIDHDRNSGNPDARVTSAWFGQGMQLKEKALSTALQMAA